MLPNTMKELEVLTTSEVAEIMHVSVATVRRWIRKGDLPAYSISGISRIKRSDLTSAMKIKPVSQKEKAREPKEAT